MIAYTPAENRAIALLFIKGEQYEELYFDAEEIIKLKDSVININNKHIEFLDNHIKVTTDLLQETSDDLIATKKDLRKAKRAEKRNGGIAGGLGVLSIILIVLLCL